MRILVVGGGSGGHVTPVVAVLRELKKRRPRAEIRFWCDYKFAPQTKRIVGSFDKHIPVHRIVAGKFRRFNHLTFWQHFSMPSLILKNFRDIFLVAIGILQSLVKLIIWRPSVVFAKGGYVCLPVGLATSWLRIPLVIHDSDAHPGLTNRVLARHASVIATGAPLEYYSYPADKARYVGIPISPDFRPFSVDKQRAAKIQWNLNSNKPLIVVTGGGLGAKRINDIVVLSLDEYLKLGSVVLISGVAQYDELRALTPPNDDKFQLHAFVSENIAQLLGAADVVIARAGATTILELAALQKPTILVPNAQLTGGHQVKNAQIYADKQAVIVADEAEIKRSGDYLLRKVQDLLADPAKAKQMAKRFASFARPRAASDMADIIISTAR